MPLQIVYENITDMDCDAIVNPTDSHFTARGGADKAIHEAAGSELAEACAEFQPLGAGEVCMTDGYNLKSRHVIHTVGPVWRGGRNNESVILRSTYINALLLAQKSGFDSIAFPLISSGRFGFPKDKVLRLATEAISDFLNVSEAEMDVYLCVYDKKSYEISRGPELAEFLQKMGCAPEPGHIPPAGVQFVNISAPAVLAEAVEAEDIASAEAVTTADLASQEDMDAAEDGDFEIPAANLYEGRLGAPVAMKPEKAQKPGKTGKAGFGKKLTLAEWIENQDDGFSEKLLKLIDMKGMTDAQCYKKANITRQTFNKIKNEKKYKPSKPTVVALAIALELNLEETEQLLRTVGFSLSRSNVFDLIIEFYIRNGVYDIYEINEALYQYDQQCLGC